MKENLKQYCLITVFDDDKVLLGYKKRGFGKGKWNGFGGKLEPGESSKDAVIRELKEEANIDVSSDNAVKIGELIFTFEEEEIKPMFVHIFKANEYSGIIKESDEMKPEWFNIDKIPYDKMWADDRIWYPYLLKGIPFQGTAHFNGDDILSHNINKSEEGFHKS